MGILFTMLRARHKSIIRQVGNEKSEFLYTVTRYNISFCIQKYYLLMYFLQQKPISRARNKEKERKEKKIPYGIVGDNKFSPHVY
jgi:hypothetical protein